MPHLAGTVSATVEAGDGLSRLAASSPIGRAPSQTKPVPPFRPPLGVNGRSVGPLLACSAPLPHTGTGGRLR